MARVIFAVTHSPTPVFNTADLSACLGGADGDSLPLDEHGLMRTMETVLFPETKLKLLEPVAQFIWRIQTDAYPYLGDQFIDERFIKRCSSEPFASAAPLPTIPILLETMGKMMGARYMWGGNYPEGINLLSQLYPSKTALHCMPPLIQDTWRIKGVDCSGFLYYATKGWTPRNTSSLVTLGKAVPIKGLSGEEIAENLQPLDLIVWAGHVICAVDNRTTIESRLPEGVIQLDAVERLRDIVTQKEPVDDWTSTTGPRFVVRRWHPENLTA